MAEGDYGWCVQVGSDVEEAGSPLYKQWLMKDVTSPADIQESFDNHPGHEEIEGFVERILNNPASTRASVLLHGEGRNGKTPLVYPSRHLNIA